MLNCHECWKKYSKYCQISTLRFPSKELNTKNVKINSVNRIKMKMKGFISNYLDFDLWCQGHDPQQFKKFYIVVSRYLIKNSQQTAG